MSSATPTTTASETIAASYSEASSLGIRTPDLDLSDIHYYTAGGCNNNNGSYTSLLHHNHQQCHTPHHPSGSMVVVDDGSQLIPSLSVSHSLFVLFFLYIQTKALTYKFFILKHQDHMTTIMLQKGYSDSEIILNGNSSQYDHTPMQQHQHFYYYDQQQQSDQTALTHLSREQLIERVVQLEMERTFRSRKRSSSSLSQQSFYQGSVLTQIRLQ